MERPLDWSSERARALGQDALELWCELLDRLGTLPVSGRFPPEALSRLALPIPDEPLPREALMAHARELFLRASRPGHPGFMGYIVGAAALPGAVGELLAGALNANVAGFRLSPGATTIETHLTGWFATEVFGLPAGAFGLMTSGGTMATVTALKVARDACGGGALRGRGVRGAEPMAIYTSSEAHVSVDRAADLLGLGHDAVRRLPVGRDGRLRGETVERALLEDARRGVRPAAVVGTAGTTATGAIDALGELAEVAARHRVWYHVDAAYGGAACLVEALRPLFRGIERADSITFDPHKWLYASASAGCLLVRDPPRLRDAFDIASSVLRFDKTRLGDGIDLGSHGPDGSRGFLAFKVWFALLAHGRRAYARSIAEDVRLARLLEARVAERPELELLSAGPLSISCFRYAPARLRGDRAALDALNERLMTEIQLDGRAFCSNAVLPEGFALRTCIVCYRTRERDIDVLLDVVAEIGHRLSQGEDR